MPDSRSARFRYGGHYEPIAERGAPRAAANRRHPTAAPGAAASRGSNNQGACHERSSPAPADPASPARPRRSVASGRISAPGRCAGLLGPGADLARGSSRRVRGARVGGPGGRRPPPGATSRIRGPGPGRADQRHADRAAARVRRGGGMVRYGIDAYRVIYQTVNATGQPVRASGLVAFPAAACASSAWSALPPAPAPTSATSPRASVSTPPVTAWKAAGQPSCSRRPGSPSPSRITWAWGWGPAPSSTW